MGRIAQGRFQGVSAGIQMAGEIHPLTLKVLEQNQFKTSHLRPKHFQEFLNVGVRPVNYVISFLGNQVPIWLRCFPKMLNGCVGTSSIRSLRKTTSC